MDDQSSGGGVRAPRLLEWTQPGQNTKFEMQVCMCACGWVGARTCVCVHVGVHVCVCVGMRTYVCVPVNVCKDGGRVYEWVYRYTGVWSVYIHQIVY